MFCGVGRVVSVKVEQEKDRIFSVLNLAYPAANKSALSIMKAAFSNTEKAPTTHQAMKWLKRCEEIKSEQRRKFISEAIAMMEASELDMSYHINLMKKLPE